MQPVVILSLCVILISSVVSSSYHPVPIRRQLYAFPRVGRGSSPAEPYHYEKKQSYEPHASDTVGLWFGPRLGRPYPAEDVDISQNEAEGGEPEQLESHSEREKRNST